jgi:hypothetical protein
MAAKVYLKSFVRKISSERQFYVQVIKYESFHEKNSLVIIYRFGSHKYFKNSVKCFFIYK